MQTFAYKQFYELGHCRLRTLFIIFWIVASASSPPTTSVDTTYFPEIDIVKERLNIFSFFGTPKFRANVKKNVLRKKKILYFSKCELYRI